MPRRRSESVQEIRYEYSLGPKEQGLVLELEESLKKINKTARIASVVAPIGLACVGWGVYEAGKWIGQGIANFSLGVTEIWEKTPAGYANKKLEEAGIYDKAEDIIPDNPIIRYMPVTWPYYWAYKKGKQFKDEKL